MTNNTPWIQETDIERLMSREPCIAGQASAGAPVFATDASIQAPLPPAPSSAAEHDAATAADLSAADAEELLRQAELAIQSMRTPTTPTPANVAPFQFEELQNGAVPAEAANLDLIRDVELNLKIELGRTQMSLDDVLKLRKGSVVALDRQAGEPVDVYANGRLIARGEVLVLDGNFCVRVAELVAGVAKAA